MDKIKKDLYFPTVYGVGFLGEGVYKPYVKAVATPEYSAWKSIMERCYSDALHAKHPTYRECEACEEWQEFQVFAAWHEENYVEGWHLDKDIKIKGNKVYSPETCFYVPPSINTLLSDCAAVRGEWPQGVYFHKASQKFMARVRVDSKTKYLGLFKTPEEAHRAYVVAKNEEIRRKCVEYPQFAEYLAHHVLEVT